MKRLAFMTVGRLHEPMGNPRVQGFIDRVPATYAAADATDGFIARSDRDLDTLGHTWGPIRHPKCFGGGTNSASLPSTLSLWEDLESVAAYAYSGAHGESLSHRKDWFASHDIPTYVAYWTDEDRPDWQDAADRLDHLHEHGPSARAFTFAHPFDAEGNPTTLDRARVAAKRPG